MCKSPSPSSHNFIPNTQKKQTGNDYIFVIGNKQSLMFFKWSVPWEENSIFLSHLEFDIQRYSDDETSKNLALLRSLKRYLNKKTLVHGQKTQTISKFSALILKCTSETLKHIR